MRLQECASVIRLELAVAGLSKRFKQIGIGVGAGIGFGIGAYAIYTANAWSRYGRRTHQKTSTETDSLLDRLMPAYEVNEIHVVRVAASANLTYSAMTDLKLSDSAVIRAIFKGRELILGAKPNSDDQSQTLLQQTQALGWGILAEIPGREIVVGAITQPWLADVEFHFLPPAEFIEFKEPGYVKIAWTLRADAAGPFKSVARTETRVVATDPMSRRKFRAYWALFSPGILLIRKLALRLVKRDAESRSKSLSQQN